MFYFTRKVFFCKYVLRFVRANKALMDGAAHYLEGMLIRMIIYGIEAAGRLETKRSRHNRKK